MSNVSLIDGHIDKMTDNEIIKALECCVSADNCNKCPYYPNKHCTLDMKHDARDLINRQQAEIERLNIENEILSINADAAFQDGLNEAQDLYAEQVKAEIKSEAIKDFAEKLKQKSEYYENGQGWEGRICYDDDIDKLLKEMVGDTE